MRAMVHFSRSPWVKHACQGQPVLDFRGLGSPMMALPQGSHSHCVEIRAGVKPQQAIFVIFETKRLTSSSQVVDEFGESTREHRSPIVDSFL